jgi:hypothetical protein
MQFGRPSAVNFGTSHRLVPRWASPATFVDELRQSFVPCFASFVPFASLGNVPRFFLVAFAWARSSLSLGGSVRASPELRSSLRLARTSSLPPAMNFGPRHWPGPRSFPSLCSGTFAGLHLPSFRSGAPVNFRSHSGYAKIVRFGLIG